IDGSRGERDIVDVASKRRDAIREPGFPDVFFGDGKHIRGRVEERDRKVACLRKRNPERPGAAADIEAPSAGDPAPNKDLLREHWVDRGEDCLCNPVHVLRPFAVEPAWYVPHLFDLRGS